MVLLIINKPGLTIEIPGLRSTRTPAEIDISKINLNVVVTYLHKMSVKDYQIISSDKKDSRTYEKYVWKDLVKKEQNNDQSINVDNILSSFIQSNIPYEVQVNTKELEEKLSKFTSVLERLIGQVPTTITVTSSGETTKELNKEKTPDEETFIPSIKNDSEMSLRGSISKVVVEEDQNVLEVADLLRGV